MATERVGVYRKYHGPVPMDATGKPLPKSEWANKRPCCWVARWFGTGGNRFSRSFETRKEAERFAETKQAEVRQGRGDPPKGCTIREFWKEHRKLSKGTVRDSTLHMQLTTMAMLAKEVGWDRDVRRVLSKEIELYRSKRLETGIATATANKEVKQLKRLFNLAIARGYLSVNPCALVALTKVGRKRVPYCSPEQFQSIFAQVVDPLWQALLTVFYQTGIRLNAAGNLTWQDIDFAAAVVHITRRDADGFVQQWSPKDHELREIPLPDQAINLLAAWQALAPEGCPYVFMEPERWEHYRKAVLAKSWNPKQSLLNNVLRRFQTLCKRAGVGKFTIHDLRRSCITNWAKKRPIHVVQQYAGHSDINTTRKYYLSVSEADAKAARSEQKKLLGELKGGDPTDPKLTPRAQKRDFPGRRQFKPLTEVDEL